MACDANLVIKQFRTVLQRTAYNSLQFLLTDVLLAVVLELPYPDMIHVGGN